MAIAIAEAWWHRVPLLQRVNPDTYYTVLVAEAGEAIEIGDLRRAEGLLHTTIRKFPKSYWAYQKLGDALAKAGDASGALTNYELAMKYCGTSPTNLLSPEQQQWERNRIAARIREIREHQPP